MDAAGKGISTVTIEEEMRGSYMDYAMSVIIGRALPDVRDGLKPVHRRILYAMLGEGLTSNKKYSKCAGVVGEVLKRLHPHGDSAVYDSLVRMAQPWNLRYPFIDGQGNFGSIDGDSAAAYRYTECRMMALAEEMLADIDKDTVDFIANFDDSSTEPVVLPARVPNLLVNGAEGIAVGMASKIPPHNLREIIAATVHLIENPEASPLDLMEFVPGPDFPTGGIIYGAAAIKQMYATGRGLLSVRAKYHIEETKSGSKEFETIVIDELPYQVNKARLIEKIAELVHDKKIEGVSKLRDESDRRGMRVVIELKRGTVSDVVVNQLIKLTQLQRTFGVTMLAIVRGQPRVMSLVEMIAEFIRHRRTVVTRRTQFELGKARARLHILDGLKIALDNIDEVVELIKSSESTPEAKARLQERFSLSDVQSQHILDMPLRRLTGLERKAIEEEHKEVTALIEKLLKILSSSKEIDAVIVSELKEISDKYGDERRTDIVETGEEIVLEDLIQEEEMVVTISHKGYAKRCSPSLYRAQGRGGKGVMGTKKSEDDSDFVSQMFVATTHAYLLVFTSAGKLHWIKVYNLPEAGRTARGRAIVNILNLGESEKVSAILPIREFHEGGWYVVLVSKKGYIKRVDLQDFSNIRKGGIRATNLDDDDALVGVALTDGKSDCVVSAKSGLVIRFNEDDVRVMGRTARGVRAIKLADGDEVVSFVSVPQGDDAEGVALLTVCQNGKGKRTALSEYRAQGRGGKGIIDIKTKNNGPVVGTCKARSGDDLMLITTAGKIIRTSVGQVSEIGRNTQGVRLINLDESESVAAVARLVDEKEEDAVAEAGEIAEAEKKKSQE